MSVAAPPPSTGAAQPAGDAAANAPAGASDSCPLCGAPLHPEQDWCLRCGAAARTRLAASSNWKAPIVALAIIVALALGVLAAALVTLAGKSNSKPTAVTTTVFKTATAVTPTTTTAPTGATGATPGATTPPAATTAPTTKAASIGTASGPLSEKPIVTPPPRAAPTTLVIKNRIVGKGATARKGDHLTVNYVGVLYNGGKEFDSSWIKGKRFKFTLGSGQAIPGWEEGVPGMKVGGRRELVVPPSLAYAGKGLGTSVPPNAPLVFVIDLLAT